MYVFALHSYRCKRQNVRTIMEAGKIAEPEELAHYYLKTHRIMELLDNITAGLVYERPGIFLFSNNIYVTINYVGFPLFYMFQFCKGGFILKK